MQKAYNHVKWDFLEAWMKKMGFYEKQFSLTMASIKSVTFSVEFNGEPLDSF